MNGTIWVAKATQLLCQDLRILIPVWFLIVQRDVNIKKGAVGLKAKFGLHLGKSMGGGGGFAALDGY